MAQAKTQERAESVESTEGAVTVASSNAVVEYDDSMFEEGAGAGMEGAGQEAFAIPFLSILQKGSPQVDPDQPNAYIDGARAGNILETVSMQLFDGKVGVMIVPCAYKRAFLRWGPRDSGGGFKGEFTGDEVAVMRSKGQIVEMDGKLYAPTEDGSVNVHRSDRFAEVRNHYCMLIEPESQTYKQVLLSLSSTQIKKSKGLMSILDGVRDVNRSGQKFKPATWANLVRMTTVSESNDKGSWYGVKFELAGLVRSALPKPFAAEVFSAGKAFNEAVTRGTVAARFEDTDLHPSVSERGGADAGADPFQ